MKAIAIIDTTVFCNIVQVPHMHNELDEVLAELEELIKSKTALLLPMATVLETGNHIAQNGNGEMRRQAALRFCDGVQKAIEGTAPWTPTPFWDVESLTQWLGEFPNRASTGVGFGDLSMIKLWEQQCELNKARRVFIWTHDEHLRSFDTGQR